MTWRWPALLAPLAVAAWLAACAAFWAYLNWFSDTGRSGDWLVLGLAWFCVLVALSATFAFLATAIFAIADRWRRHA